MIPRMIFTRRFFELSGYDQAAVVSAVIRDIQGTIGCHLNPIHDRQAEQRVKRIRARALKYGIHGAYRDYTTKGPLGLFSTRREYDAEYE